jgi:hypothetical protein
MKIISTQVIPGGRPQEDGRIYGRRLRATFEDGHEGNYPIDSRGVVRVLGVNYYYNAKITGDSKLDSREMDAALKYCGLS